MVPETIYDKDGRNSRDERNRAYFNTLVSFDKPSSLTITHIINGYNADRIIGKNFNECCNGIPVTIEKLAKDKCIPGVVVYHSLTPCPKYSLGIRCP